ncbi:MAG: rubredoxin [Thermoplasmata archaeon]|nr:rubredoxin [Thermoplasmata archaeon]
MKYRCPVCGYIYDEEKMGVKFEDLPDDWECPICGEPKSEFKPIED